MATNTDTTDVINIADTTISSDNKALIKDRLSKLLEKDTSFTDMQDIFIPIRNKMSQDQEAKEVVRTSVNKLDEATHDLYTALQQIHTVKGSTIDEIMKTAESFIPNVKEQISTLKELVGSHYYKYNNMWCFSMTRIVSCLALIQFLKNRKLLTLSEAASQLEIGDHKSTRVFRLDIEDYLSSILNLASELSRYSVNSVSQGDLNMPFQIVTFLAEIDAGFKLLVFKNDNLRRKFDGLKYDIKKTEEVVYDLTIRGVKRDPTTVTHKTQIEDTGLTEDTEHTDNKNMDATS